MDLRLSDEELDKNPERIRDSLDSFNNFFCKLPGGYYRWELTRVEDIPEWYPQIDKDFWLKLRKNTPDLSDRTFFDIGELVEEGHSSLYISKTPRILFEDIDSCLVDTGISLDEVKEANYNALRKNEGVSNITREKGPLVIPAYIELREMGYNHYDLSS